MRQLSLVCFLLIFGSIHPAAAQEWEDFVSPEDGVRIIFPGKPQAQTTTFTSQFGYKLPQKIYSASRGESRFSLTVVDYRGLEQQGMERSKACPQTDERCRGGLSANSLTGAGYWSEDVRGAIIHAIFTFTKRNAKISDLTWGWQDRVEGVLIQLTNADGSQTCASISMHDNRLYIAEATVPGGYPPPNLFPQAIGYVDKDGKHVEYRRVYSNMFHALDGNPLPPRAGQ